MSEGKRLDELTKALERFHEVERVRVVAFGESQDMVRVYVVVSGNENDEGLRSRLSEIEESIVREFSEFAFKFHYV